MAAVDRAGPSAALPRTAGGCQRLLGLRPVRRQAGRLREEADGGVHREGVMVEVLGISVSTEEADRILESSICIPCMMPFITSQFLCREPGNRPQVVPEGTANLAFIGQSRGPRRRRFHSRYSVRIAQAGGLLAAGARSPSPRPSTRAITTRACSIGPSSTYTTWLVEPCLRPRSPPPETRQRRRAPPLTGSGT